MQPFFARILLGLSPSVVVGSPQARQPTAPDCTEFFHLVNSELVGVGERPGDAGMGVTDHRGLTLLEDARVHLWSLEPVACVCAQTTWAC